MKRNNLTCCINEQRKTYPTFHHMINTMLLNLNNNWRSRSSDPCQTLSTQTMCRLAETQTSTLSATAPSAKQTSTILRLSPQHQALKTDWGPAHRQLHTDGRAMHPFKIKSRKKCKQKQWNGWKDSKSKEWAQTPTQQQNSERSRLVSVQRVSNPVWSADQFKSKA